MKLSTKGRYAVMAMVDLAGNVENDRPIGLCEIAKRQEISVSYLEQLFAPLRQGKLVCSVRGPGGGYLLARPTHDIRIADILRAVDESMHTTRCSPGATYGCRSNHSRCLTHNLWASLDQHIDRFLSAVTLADVMDRGRSAGLTSHEGRGYDASNLFA